MRRVIVASVLLLAASTAAMAGFSGSDLFLISVGRGPGANDSFWYTTVWLHNPGTVAESVTISFLRRDQANPAPDQQFLAISPGETLTIGDALWDLFGLETGAGALRFETEGRIVVSSRIFNLPGSDLAESQGQFMAGLPAELAVAVGDATDVPGITQPTNGDFRCNFAMVETAGANAVVDVALVNGAGVELATRSYTLLPYQPLQKNLSDLGADAVVTGGRLHVEVVSGSGRVLAVASMVGNGEVSQDPSTLEMEFGLATAVSGLTLPYDGSVSTAGPAFKVTNTATTGHTYAVRGDNSSTSGGGVFGWATAWTGATAGVFGQTSSNAGAGTVGFAGSETGETYGVVGTSLSSLGVGVYGVAMGESGTRAHGVHGKTSSYQSGGVYAEGDDDFGADLILAGAKGSIYSDRQVDGSFLELRSYDTVSIFLDVDNDDRSRFTIWDGDYLPVFTALETGDVKQTEFAQGLVKAGAEIYCSETATAIRKSFNLINNPPITVENGRAPGMCLVDFPFIVEDHYVVVSAVGQTVFAGHGTDVYTELYAIFRYDMFVGGTADGWVSILVY
jgi:hypothetical protein